MVDLSVELSTNLREASQCPEEDCKISRRFVDSYYLSDLRAGTQVKIQMQSARKMIERELQARVSWVSSEERWGCRENEELMSINTAKLVRCWHWHTVSSWGVISS